MNDLTSTKYLLSDADLGREEADAVAEVVLSKWLSAGPRCAEFEEKFAAAMGVPCAVSVANCTCALHLALMAVDVGPGDEVLVPSYTFVATANAVRYVGATPVFVDIVGEHDLNMDPADAAAKITPRTRAIMPVHMAGFPADMDAIMALAARHKLRVVEDACHAIGATSTYCGMKAGAIGDIGCFSFFANKNLVTGEGGMLITRDESLAKRLRLIRSHGMTKTSWDKAAGRATGYDVVEMGFNFRPTELTAALGLVQLGKLDRNNARRRRLVARYRRNLAEVPGVTMPFADRLDDSAHHVFAIVLADAAWRQPLRDALDAAGVQTTIHYQPVHQFTHMRDVAAAVSLPRTEDVAARELTLPLHPLLSEADIDEICRRFVAALDGVRQPACV